jgi:uracil-DNA glycosylase family 4
VSGGPGWLEEGARFLRDLSEREGGMLVLPPGQNRKHSAPVERSASRQPDLFAPAEGVPWGGAPPRSGIDPVGIPPAMQAPVPEDPRERSELLEQLARQAAPCLKCALGETRSHFVFGSGRADAALMFVGEAPGAEEDAQGLPFVGAAGQLLTKIIESIGFAREDVYIANILKCRPPGNRDPQAEEVAACEPYLQRQIALIRPRVICALGRIAGQVMLKTSAPLARLRERVHIYQGRPLLVTFHPAALLRNPNWKRPTWEDMKMLRRIHDEEAGS